MLLESGWNCRKMGTQKSDWSIARSNKSNLAEVRNTTARSQSESCPSFGFSIDQRARKQNRQKVSFSYCQHTAGTATAQGLIVPTPSFHYPPQVRSTSDSMSKSFQNCDANAQSFRDRRASRTESSFDYHIYCNTRTPTETKVM